MQFYSNEFLSLLWLALGIILLFIYWQKKRKTVLAQLINLKLLSQLVPAYRLNVFLMRTACFVAAFVFLTLALARPQWGREQKTIQRKGVDIIFMIDTSLSMLTEDVKPNRITKARLIVDSFVKKLTGDRIGLVVFAGSAYIATPLTLDYSAFRLFLDSTSVGIVPEQGTNLKAAIATALVAFPKKEKLHKVIILLSDGEHHEGDVRSWVEKARSEGVKIYCIGVGTKEGEPIPLRAGKDKVSGYKKDKSGEVVVSKLEDKVLKDIAEHTGGKYYPATPDEREVELIYRNMQTLGKKEFKEKQVSMRQDHFQLFILIGLFFLFLEDLIRESRRRSKIKAASLALLLFGIWLSQSAFSLDPLASKSQEADNLYEKAKYEDALKTYRSEQVKHPENPELRYNVGTTLYKTKDFKEARYQLDSAIQKIADKNLRAKAYYNRGNTLYRLGDMDGAIESYQKALENNPSDQDAKFNLELLKKKKEAQSNEHKEDQNKQEQKQNQKQQNKNQQQQNQQNQQNQQSKQNQQQQNQQQQGQGEKQNQSQGQGSDQKQQDKNQSQGQDQKKQEEEQNQNQQQQDQQNQKNQQDQQQANQKNDQDQQSKENQKNQQQNQQNQQQNKQDQESQQNQQNQQDQNQKSEQQKQDQSKSDQNQNQQQQQDQQTQQDKQTQKSQQQKQEGEQGKENRQDQPQLKQEGEKQEQKENEQNQQDKGKEGKEQSEQDQNQAGEEPSKSDEQSQKGSEKEKNEMSKGEEQKPSEDENLDLKADLNQDEGKSQENNQKDQEDLKDQKNQEKDEERLKDQNKEEKEGNQGKESDLENEPDLKNESQEQAPSPAPSYIPTVSEPLQPESPAPSYRPAPQGALGAASPSEEEGEEKGLVAVATGGAPQFKGDMSEQQALKILNAVNSEEKQLLVMRRPPRQREANQQILKDW